MKISLPFWQHFEGGEGLSLLVHGALGPERLIIGHAFGLDPLRVASVDGAENDFRKLRLRGDH
jgi:hypothetical protein